MTYAPPSSPAIRRYSHVYPQPTQLCSPESAMSAPNPAITASLSSQRLSDKIAVITGASSGLGRAIALTYATHGAAVVCADLQPVAEVHVKEGDVKATHEVILENGGKSLFVDCDVRDSQSVQRLIARTVEVYGRLDM